MLASTVIIVQARVCIYIPNFACVSADSELSNGKGRVEGGRAGKGWKGRVEGGRAGKGWKGRVEGGRAGKGSGYFTAPPWGDIGPPPLG